MKAHLIALLFLLFCSMVLRGQISGYRFTHEQGTFMNVADYPDAVITDHKSDDELVTPTRVALPMAFRFGGRQVDSLSISANGFIWFGSAGRFEVPTEWPISQGDDTGIKGVVSALGIDLMPRPDATVRSAISGRAPFRLFIIEWLNTGRIGPDWKTLPGDTFNFQIRLYETVNRVEVNYGTMVFDPVRAESGEIGLRGLTSTDFSNRSGTWPATTKGGKADTRISLSSRSGPGFGQLLVWEPEFSTGVAPERSVADVTVYPVPVLDVLRLKDPKAQFGKGSYSVYSSVGQRMSAGTINGAAIPTGHLRPGTYFLLLNNESGQARVPFVKVE